ncbi:YdiU family protein [Radiobacillus kanasensis]|uniref:protein adenylyltransferase SelO n=1 Tax=Radiobacillus kanasensis TaxID=2844358 RepID=UPI001E5EAF52|nr:YdiU family protein [Radiobacillus kanasensis]UFU00607.1 YdiU family protein [Radiobacillus kanasensis]
MKKTESEKIKLENSYTQLPEVFYTLQDPTPVTSPEFVIFNAVLAQELGLDAKLIQSEEGAAILAGNQVPDHATPLAQAYAGHQFGHFTMLGDGRAILLGEHITPDDNRRDIQLKGAGRTPYSRGGDGRAALGPMLREYIISEAMHALGVPTTRSLAVVSTGEPTYRETELPGAILTRVAASHLRVGTFQYARKWGTQEDLRALADYAIKRHYPEVWNQENRYVSFLRELIKKQAVLIAKWQLVGFIHGVMNTDNMTISGETIDYGPCAFMDVYSPETVFSSIDVQGRYAYQNQPYIAGWNLARFAEAILPLLDKDQDRAIEIANKEVTSFLDLYNQNWLAGMRGKLGIFNEETEDEKLVEQLLEIMEKEKADYTNTFRGLTFPDRQKDEVFQTDEFANWKEKWEARLQRQDESMEDIHYLMRESNPAVIPRNHKVEEALEAAVAGDNSVMNRLLDVLKNPYAHTNAQEEYGRPPATPDPAYRTYCGT